MKKIFLAFVFTLIMISLLISIQKKDFGEERQTRFIDHRNGTITDTKTNLMWASKDNGSKINWHDAHSYCQKFNGGGYSDWRMPTLKELSGLYDKKRPRKHRTTPLIKLSNQYIWATETIGSSAAPFTFIYGRR
ncbi:MAG: DUF1566 domain-containing protein, partial [candidate division Zixibacteria bacterium]|nr:DUF1566 domain-containing protein [candidate division Zixibacteria bacterium]